MDAVITYVNGLDPAWQKEYARAVGHEVLAKRFRDWGTLKYLLRGIEKFMPYVDNVYLVVSGMSQVPEWVDAETVKVVTHDMFLPGEFLPTFNSNPLEMYMHKIPGLGEEFIYFNDDFFPMDYSSREDFFRDGKVVMSPSRDFLTLNMFKKICRNSDRLARKAAGVEKSCGFLRPQHCCAPMLRSVHEEVYAKVREEIDKTASRKIRTEEDITQYLYSDYAFLTGRSAPGRLSNKHFSLGSTSIRSLVSFIDRPTAKFACINDVKLPDKRVEAFRDALLAAFERRFPSPSKFEKV